MKPLHRRFIGRARRHPFALRWRMAGRKTSGSFGLTKTIFLARDSAKSGRDRNVGILLPPSVGGALVNLAALFSASARDLNYTASNESLASVAQQCEIKTSSPRKRF